MNIPEEEIEKTEYQKFLQRTLDFHNFSVAAHVDRILRDKGAANKDVHEAIMSTPTDYHLPEPEGVHLALSQPQKNGFTKLSDQQIKTHAIYVSDDIVIGNPSKGAGVYAGIIEGAQFARNHYESQSVSQPQWIDVKERLPKDHFLQ